MTDWKTVARISRTKNLKGGLVVECTTSPPVVISPGLSVYIVPPPELQNHRRLNIKEASAISQTSYELRFSEINNVDEAHLLVGRYILINTHDVHYLSNESKETCIGFDVIDAVHGKLGMVEEIICGKHQDLISVKSDKRTILIPLVEEFVQFDIEDRCVRTEIPEGLLEI